MKATAIRKLRKELQNKSYVFRRGSNFDDVGVLKALQKKYKPLFDKALKNKADDVITISLNPRYRGSVGVELKSSCAVEKIAADMHKEYLAAQEKWENETTYGKWKRIDSQLEALEVEALLGEVSDKSPEIVKLMDEIRTLLTLKEAE